MSSSTVIDVFGHILYSFTRGVTEHYNPDEPEFTDSDSFNLLPLIVQIMLESMTFNFTRCTGKKRKKDWIIYRYPSK